MKMDWRLVIERNCEALSHVVAVMFALVGLVGGRAVRTRPRHLRSRVMKLLRPAESAVRRLIYIAALHCVGEVKPPRAGRKAEKPKPAQKSVTVATSGPFNLGLATWYRPPGDGEEAPGAEAEALDATDTAIPAFPLFDPIKRFEFQRRRHTKTMPRVRCLSSDWSLPVYMRTPEPPARPKPAPDDELDVRRLCLRLLSLRRALDDIDGHARRLARIRTRRDTPAGRPRRRRPLRPGWPPGRRKRPIHDIDEILRECHSMAIYAESPDTS